MRLDTALSSARRRTSLGALAASALALASPGAHAGPCGAAYTVALGDTLATIAQQCRVPVDTIRRANPGVTPRTLEAGATLSLPADAASAETADPPGRHRIRPDDTLFSIGQRYGVSVAALRAANPGVDPDDLKIGSTLTIPAQSRSDDTATRRGDAGDPRISIAPASAAAGAPVTVRATGLRPGETVTVGVGPDQSEWSRLASAVADAGGAASASVSVPDSADPGDRLVFVVDRPGGTTLRSGRFDVVAGTPGDAAVTVEGRVSGGPECPVLETPGGEIYSLVGNGLDVAPGSYVEVTGRRAEMSFCMHGTALAVDSVRPAAPPARDRDPARAGGLPLDRAYVLGSWAEKGGDCTAPRFAVRGNPAGGQVVKTRIGGRSRTGYVALGDDPAFVFDRQRLPLETRGPDGLAVMPPAGGSATLDGVPVRGDGTVFIRCNRG